MVIEFYFSSPFYSSALCTLYFFLYNFFLLSYPLFHSDVQSNFLISLSLFCCLTSRGGENLKVLLFFVQSLFTFFPHFRLWVASKTMTFWGNTTVSLSVICLSSLTSSSLFEPPQALSSRLHFSCSRNYTFNGACMKTFFACVFVDLCNTDSIIWVVK